MSMSLDELIRLKIELLFHDPPHKSFLINVLGDNFGFEHEKYAKAFRAEVLNGTKFSAVSTEDIMKLTKFCDVISSTIERRLLKGWPKGKFLKYDKLHNIFDPVGSKELVLSDFNVVDDVSKELNNILNTISAYVDDVTFYNILYVAYELLWYERGLPPSLADTRIPTHTIFDHLYSCTTIANMVMKSSDEFKLSGFYVIIDFPGIQKFVGSGRKAGDFWASSWLLSNIMWRIAEHFARKYGFDVIISPTARLNPYTLKSVRSWLSSTGVDVKILEKILKRLKKAFAGALNISLDELEEFMNQPIIPATITLLLPAIGFKDPKDVINEVSKAYLSSWNSVVEEVLSELEHSDKPVEKLIYKYLSNAKDITSLPPHGVRIFVVDISKLHNTLSKCIVSGDVRVCSDLGLNIDVKKLANIIENSGISYDDVIMILLWHLISTKATELASRFGDIRTPIPRPFWILDDTTLKPVSDSFIEKGGWEPCILCSSEPAIVKLSKVVVKKDGREEIDFAEGIEGLSGDDLIEFKKHFKPGEALGPYCLLKRAIYLVNIGKFRFVSTDDILLEGTSNILVELEKDCKFLSKLMEDENLKKLNGEKISLIQMLLKPRKDFIKDIDTIATFLNTTYDGLVSLINDSISRGCKGLADKREDKFLGDILRNLITSVLGIDYSKVLPKELKMFTDNPLVLRVDGICKSISIPKTFAIVRCDGDNIGKFLMGEMPLELDEYIKRLLAIIENTVKTLGIDEHVLNHVREGFNTLRELLNSLGIKHIPVSPARTTATSLALMMSAINDLRIVKDGYGMVIFSGGDDVLALTPSQTALRIAIELRRSFSDEYFRQIGNVIVPTIPTGRSVSVRFVGIADLMNYELSKTLELLEDLGKRCKWVVNGKEFTKDTVVISDSRAKITALLPLHKELRDLTETALNIGFLVGVGILSSNTPNDFINVVKDPKLLNSKALEVFTKYVMKRNVVTSINRESYAEKLIQLLNEWFSKSSNTKIVVNEEEGNLITEVMNLLMIMRREL